LYGIFILIKFEISLNYLCASRAPLPNTSFRNVFQVRALADLNRGPYVCKNTTATYSAITFGVLLVTKCAFKKRPGFRVQILGIYRSVKQSATILIGVNWLRIWPSGILLCTRNEPSGSIKDAGLDA